MKTYKVEKYSQNGEGVVFENNIPIYVTGVILNEIIEIKIITEKATFKRAKLTKIISASKNRIDHKIKNIEKIGGYELLHMNQVAQANFKKTIIINDFKKIAQVDISDIKIVQGKNNLRYRNKITLHNGCFYEKNSHKPLCLEDYLLTNIIPQSAKRGKIIIRQLDTRIEGRKEDKKFTTDSMFNLQFKISIGSFYQVNKEITKVIYQIILDKIKYGENVLDLYSGIGTIALIVASKAKQVVALERNNSSFKDAIQNIKNNNIKNVQFLKQDVRNYLRDTKTNFDSIIVDPAREGLGKNVCQSLLRLKPKKIIYLSCHPATQAADFKHLKKHYKILFKKSYDMFPQTCHIENLLVLELMK